MAKVKIRVLDKYGEEEYRAKVEEGTDLIDAVEAAGVHLPASCGRGSWCGTCSVTILEGEMGPGKAIDTSGMGPEEMETMERLGLDPKTQVLSCATQIRGDCKVQETGVGGSQ